MSKRVFERKFTDVDGDLWEILDSGVYVHIVWHDSTEANPVVVGIPYQDISKLIKTLQKVKKAREENK